MGDAMAALQAMAKASSSSEKTPPRGAGWMGWPGNFVVCCD